MSDPRQWVQPLFMVYNHGTDQMAPLTQERLDSLLKIERMYGQIINSVRDSHADLVTSLGGVPKPWAEHVDPPKS